MNSFEFCSESVKCRAGKEHCPGPWDRVSHYTQITLTGKCIIPPPKPDSERLVGKFHSIEVRKAETVDSVEFKDSNKCKGKKVIVAGNLHLGIEYSAQSLTQKVYFFECEIPFNAMVLHCHCDEEHLFPPDFCLDDYMVYVCLEHLEVERISERVFEHAAILMIWLQHK